MGVAGMGPVPYDIGSGMQLRDAVIFQPIPIGALACALANTSPTEHMLGENLYRLVEQLEVEVAEVREMDQTEVLHLLESPDALMLKVAETMDVLKNVSQQQQDGSPADQLAALSLNDGNFS